MERKISRSRYNVIRVWLIIGCVLSPWKIVGSLLMLLEEYSYFFLLMYIIYIPALIGILSVLEKTGKRSNFIVLGILSFFFISQVGGIIIMTTGDSDFVATSTNSSGKTVPSQPAVMRTRGEDDINTFKPIQHNSTSNNLYCSQNQTVEKGFVRRAELLIEDHEYEKADYLLEQYLNADPECSKAYICKLMIEYRLSTEDEIATLKKPLDDNRNFIKAIRFADEEYKTLLLSYNQKIKDNFEKRRLEFDYENACSLMNEEMYEEAIKEFSLIINYKDSSALLESCHNKQIQKKAKQEFVSLKNKIDNLFYESAFDYDSYSSYVNQMKCIEGDLNIDEFLESTAIRLKNYEERQKAEKEKKERIIKEKEELIREEHEKALKEFECEKQRIESHRKISLISGIAALVSMGALLLAIIFGIAPAVMYHKAMEKFFSSDYETAWIIYDDLGDYKDSENQKSITCAAEYLDKGDYETGLNYMFLVADRVKIVYDADGGTMAVDSEMIDSNYKLDKIPEKEGATFDSWLVSGYSMDVTTYYLEICLKAKYD